MRARPICLLFQRLTECNTVPITVPLIKEKKKKLESKCGMLANSYIKKISNESRNLFFKFVYI